MPRGPVPGRFHDLLGSTALTFLATIDSRGRPVFAVSIAKDGFNPYSAPIWAKTNKCSHLMPDLPGAPFQVSP